VNSILKLTTTLTCLLAFASCDHKQGGFTTGKFAKVSTPGFKTEQEVTSLLGPGTVVKDANAEPPQLTEPGIDAAMNRKYVDSIIASRSLAPTARIIRYHDQSQPRVFCHVVFVDGRVVETDTWKP
jgi:hypothetical protein